MKSVSLKFCIIVPCYEEHAKKLEQTLMNLMEKRLAIIVIDDGSSKDNGELIASVTQKLEVTLIKNPTNLGKGGAVKAGIKKAHELGYTHAIQIDSDGQHDSSLLQKFIEKSNQFPNKLISGKPIFDESIPKKRLYGRYFTHMWVWLETLSFQIEDTMCGFRSYPVAATHALINSSRIGNHMDFDIEIMVKLFWSGVEVEFIPLKVLYPEEGKSYFYMVKDNYRITKMHTFLVLGMLLRFPKLIVRKFSAQSWSEASEKGGAWLMHITSFLYGILGHRFVHFLCYFIAFYYYLLARTAKACSKQYQLIYQEYCKSLGLRPKEFSTYSHILNFSHMVVDKLAIWKGNITEKDFVREDIDQLISIHKPGQGAIFISSHFGNIEVIRGLGKKVSRISYSSLIYTQNSKKIFSVLKRFDPEVEKNIIPVEKVGPEMGVRLEKKIEEGEWLFCMGDRVTVQSDKTISLSLLGKPVDIPQGPFLLSYILSAPEIYAIHCFRENEKYRIKLKNITPTIPKTRANRAEFITTVAENYLRELETHIILNPSQWFNFYKYWNIK